MSPALSVVSSTTYSSASSALRARDRDLAVAELIRPRRARVGLRERVPIIGCAAGEHVVETAVELHEREARAVAVRVVDDPAAAKAAVRRRQVAATECAVAIKNRDLEMAVMRGDYGYERAFSEPIVLAEAITVLARRSSIVQPDRRRIGAADVDVPAGVRDAAVPIAGSLLVESYLRAVLAEVTERR